MPEFRLDVMQMNGFWYWIVMKKEDSLTPTFTLENKYGPYPTREAAEIDLKKSTYWHYNQIGRK